LAALPYAKSLSITSPALKAVWEGVVLDLPNDQSTLYVHGKGVEHMELRERCLFFSPYHLIHFLTSSPVSLLSST
jgi:hypothetical protein